MYWALVHLLAERVKPRGQVFGTEAWHTWLRSKFLGCTDYVLPSGKTLAIPNSTAELDTAAFSAYFEQVQAWAAERDVFLADAEAA